MPGICLLCASNPLDEFVLVGTGNNAVCSGLTRSVAFDGHESKEHTPESLAVGLHGGNIKIFC